MTVTPEDVSKRAKQVMTLEDVIEAIDRALVADFISTKGRMGFLAVPCDIFGHELIEKIRQAYSETWNIEYGTEIGYESETFNRIMGYSIPSMCNTYHKGKTRYTGDDQRVFRSFLYFSPKEKAPVEY